MTTLIQDLYDRDLIKDITQNFKFNNFKNFYTGFDPTAKSLHVGNLLLIINIIRINKYGLTPIIVLGGATACLGDPSGKLQASKKILHQEMIFYNVDCIYKQLTYLFDKYNCRVIILNNYKWFKEINIISFLQDVGRYFTINYMLSKDAVKSRLSDKGINFNEFSYQLFQAYDFLFLYKHMKCNLQIGGSDQWGNIISGIDLIKCKINKTAYGLTLPIIANRKGEKIGKSNNSNNTIWLNQDMTSIYKFYQFWLQQPDKESKYLIKFYSLQSLNIVDSIIYKHEQNPNKHYIQKFLSKEMTIFIYGVQEFNRVYKCSSILYNSKYLYLLQNINTKALFSDTFRGVPYKIFHDKKYVKSLYGMNILFFLVELINFISSKSEAKRLLMQKCIYLNNKPITLQYSITKKDIIYNHYILLRKGKRNAFIIFCE